MFDACFDPCGLLAIIDRRLQELCELRDKKLWTFPMLMNWTIFAKKKVNSPRQMSWTSLANKLELRSMLVFYLSCNTLCVFTKTDADETNSPQIDFELRL
jgi:hypothetical protein